MPVAAPAADANDDAALWSDYGWPLVASGSVLLLCAVAYLVWRHRRNARHRAELAMRRTQFHMSAIDPRVASQHAAAWEPAPARARPAAPSVAPWAIPAAPPQSLKQTTLGHTPSSPHASPWAPPTGRRA